jgi:hypothetical protein
MEFAAKKCAQVAAHVASVATMRAVSPPSAQFIGIYKLEFGNELGGASVTRGGKASEQHALPQPESARSGALTKIRWAAPDSALALAPEEHARSQVHS